MKKMIMSLIFINFSLFFVYAQSGWQNMLITNDPTQYNSIQFVDANTGWAVGWVSGFAVGCRIAKSINGGATWQCQLDNPFPALFDLHFINSNTGWAVGLWDAWKTTNGGTQWINIYNSGGLSIRFVNENTGFILGARNVTGGTIGSISRTINGGANWDTSSVPSCTALKGIFFINNSTGWISGNGGTLLKTTNSNVFVQENIGTQADLYSVFFYDELTGWVGGRSVLFKTSDGGLNWLNQISGFGISVKEIQFVNSSTGWFSGDSSAGVKVYHSTNGGISWNQQFVTGGNHPTVYFHNTNTGWFVGGFASMKTTNGGVTFINPISTEIPKQFSLSQNYPNPFNPVTKIKFAIPPLNLPLSGQRTGFSVGDREGVLLIIYDVLGREITTLVNQQLQPGTYEVEWPAPSGDASQFTSGVYFYRISAGDFVETKRMVLVK